MHSSFRRAALLAAALAPACAQISPAWVPEIGYSTRAPSIVQGMVGVTDFADVTVVARDSSTDVLEDGGLTTLPMLGGAMQLVTRDGRAQLGVEAGFSFGWDNDRTAVALGNNTLVVIAENDVFLSDAFVGAYVNLPLGRAWRLYGGAGPLLQYGRVELEYPDQNGDRARLGGEGFGAGVYARTGLEFELRPGVLVGLGVRWLESEFSAGGGLGTVEYDGYQYAFTVSNSY